LSLTRGALAVLGVVALRKGRLDDIAPNTVTGFGLGERLFIVTPVVEKMLFVALRIRSMA
jgi:hypothetical protein